MANQIIGRALEAGYIREMSRGELPPNSWQRRDWYDMGKRFYEPINQAERADPALSPKTEHEGGQVIPLSIPKEVLSREVSVA